jgi:hypothetical protein
VAKPKNGKISSSNFIICYQTNLTFCYLNQAGGPEEQEKNRPNFEKRAKTVAKPQNDKISSSIFIICYQTNLIFCYLNQSG